MKAIKKISAVVPLLAAWAFGFVIVEATTTEVERLAAPDPMALRLPPLFAPFEPHAAPRAANPSSHQ